VLRIPAAIGRYNVIDRIGHGGMGIVYRASDPRIGRVVAIKVLRVDSDELRNRFEREARSAGGLSHTNIVTIHDYGELDGQPFIVMEYVHGQTLSEQIQQRTPLSLARKFELMDMLCSGLDYAHRQGVIHRDIKPANLMIDRHGVLKILDFGIARVQESGMTQSGGMVGTPNYMSPEQVEGLPADARSDIFSVGLVFYELLSYRQAFSGESTHGVLDRVLKRAPEPLSTLCPGLDPAVVSIVDKAIEKRPRDRYQTLALLKADLDRCRARLTSAMAAAEGSETLAGSVAHAPARKTPPPSSQREILSKRRAEQLEAHLNAAREALEAADFDAAINAGEQAAILDPDNRRALQLLDRAREGLDRKRAEELLTEAATHLEQGQLERTQELIDAALELAPDSPRAAALTQELGKARAEAELRERLRHEEERKRAARDLAASSEARFRRGDHQAALDALASFDPPHPIVAEMRDRLTAELTELQRKDREREERARQERAREEAEHRAQAERERREQEARAARQARAEAERKKKEELERLKLAEARAEAERRAQTERERRDDEARKAADPEALELERADLATIQVDWRPGAEPGSKADTPQDIREQAEQRHPSQRDVKVWIAAAGVLVALTGGGLLLYSRLADPTPDLGVEMSTLSGPEPERTIEPAPQESPAPAPPVPVTIDVVPWAEVQIRPVQTAADAQNVSPIEGITPLVLDLAPGNYVMRLSSPLLARPQVETLTVTPSGPNAVRRTLPGFDLSRVVAEALP
jgi:serine/threonine-protein kinase